jgi:hypothetical protein
MDPLTGLHSNDRQLPALPANIRQGLAYCIPKTIEAAKLYSRYHLAVAMRDLLKMMSPNLSLNYY